MIETHLMRSSTTPPPHQLERLWPKRANGRYGGKFLAAEFPLAERQYLASLLQVYPEQVVGEIETGRDATGYWWFRYQTRMEQAA